MYLQSTSYQGQRQAYTLMCVSMNLLSACDQEHPVHVGQLIQGSENICDLLSAISNNFQHYWNYMSLGKGFPNQSHLCFMISKA